MDLAAARRDRDEAATSVSRLVENVSRVVIGKTQAVELLLIALLCEGHVLIEDVPGVGKTLLAKAFARSLGGSFKRIQFTPQLQPTDLTSAPALNPQTGKVEFVPGPIFAQIVLADEVNRASPPTQAALLEAMGERQVTLDGITMPLPWPFLVVATQNPLDVEGTFPLPRAQLDRFLLHTTLGYPSPDEELEMLRRFEGGDALADLEPVLSVGDLRRLQDLAAAVRVPRSIPSYIVALVQATRTWPGVRVGASPRASLALYRTARARACLRGRTVVEPDDVRTLAPCVLGHRLALASSPDAPAPGPLGTLQRILDQVPIPAEGLAGALD